MISLEKDLLGKIKNGDDKAFRHLFQSNYSPMCAFANVFVHKPEIAEEIVQDIFLKFWDSRSDILINTSIRAYLFKMVHNASLNYSRDHATNKIIKEESLDFDVFSSQWNNQLENSILDKILSDEVESELNHAMMQLPEQCREIFILCRFDDLTYVEIAKKKNISVSTVKTQMSRAMDKLYSALKEQL